MKKIALVLISLAGCSAGTPLSVSGDGGSTNANAGVFSCNITSGIHLCDDYVWSGGVYSTASAANDCAQNSGTTGTGCSHVDSLGGCAATTMSGTTSVTRTTWYYAATGGTTASVQKVCSGTSKTFVNP